MTVDERLVSERFPRASRYHPEWVLAGVSGGANPLWLTEWLTEALDLRPGMRVLDLGCGRAMSSIFLRREFGVQVWATDLWFSASENLQRIRDAGVEDGVFPIHADARSLPFAAEFFDAIVSIDSFIYYGTDDLYLNYLARFVKPGGPVGIAGAGLMREIEGPVPEHLREWWATDLPGACTRRPGGGGTGSGPASWTSRWPTPCPTAGGSGVDWLKLIAPENVAEIQALEADAGRHLGYVRAVGRRRAEAQLFDPFVSVPAEYTKKPLLRDGE